MRDIELLCERIYDAAIDAESWPDVLQNVANAAGCKWGALLTRRSDAWVGWRISPADTAAVDAYLRSDGPQRSITTERLFSIGHPGFVSDHEHFTKEERRTDGYFQWAKANGFEHGAATGFQLNTGDLAVVQVMRRTGERPLGAADIELLDRFRPHLARAAMLAARWKMERLRAATEALALVGLPAMVLSADCRVMAVNSLAQDLPEHVVWLARDGLALIDTTAHAKLKRQVSACAVSGSIDSASSFPAWDQERKAPMIVHVVPLRGDRRDLFEGGLALVLFTQASAPNQPNAQLIREIFDLTAAEARVAALLAQGRSVEQIANLHGVGQSTVRSQAKSILQKLGAHRQSEIAARLSGAHCIRPLS